MVRVRQSKIENHEIRRLCLDRIQSSPRVPRRNDVESLRTEDRTDESAAWFVVVEDWKLRLMARPLGCFHPTYGVITRVERQGMPFVLGSRVAIFAVSSGS